MKGNAVLDSEKLKRELRRKVSEEFTALMSMYEEKRRKKYGR